MQAAPREQGYGIPARRPDRLVSALGLVGLLCSPAFLVALALGGFDNPSPPRSVLLAQLSFLVGWLCSIVGLSRPSAAGRGRGRFILRVQMAGIMLATTQELQDLLLSAPNHAGALYRVADAAWPLSVLFMIVTGVAVSRAGVITGWRRLTPVFCGLALPVSMLVAALAGNQAMGPAFATATTIAWAALAYAVITSARTRRSVVEDVRPNAVPEGAQ